MKQNKNKISNEARTILVIAFIAIYILISYISLRGQYLEYAELGEQYVEIFFTNLKYKYSIMGISFIILSISIYFTNRGIRKGLKPFFEQEKKEMPKLPNKSITLIISAIVSVIYVYKAINRAINKIFYNIYNSNKYIYGRILYTSIQFIF